MSLRRLRSTPRFAVLLATGFWITALAAVPTRASEDAAPRSDLLSFLWEAPNTRLFDATAHEIWPDDLRDKVVAIGFFDTQCSAPCALRMLDLAKVSAALPADARKRIAVLALTGDPAHDTAAEIVQFAAGMGLAPTAVTLLRADEAAMRRLYQSIGWRQSAATPDNVPPTIFVFDRLGRSAMRYDASPLDQPRLVRDLTTLVAFSHGVGSPPDIAAATP